MKSEKADASVYSALEKSEACPGDLTFWRNTLGGAVRMTVLFEPSSTNISNWRFTCFRDRTFGSTSYEDEFVVWKAES